MKTFWFYNSQEQENGDALGIEGADGQKIALVLPDGYDLKRDAAVREDYTYSVMEGDQILFQFVVLPVRVIAPPLGPLPAAVILREKGDTHEGTLE
jgi:hypothetical protein